MEQTNGIKAWVTAMRLRTLPLAAACIIMGTAIAARWLDINWTIFGLTMITALLLQILSNLANDFGDFSKGTDDKGRIGPTRAMQSGSITKSAMVRAIVITSVLSLISGLYLLYIAFGSLTQPWSLVLLAIGVISIGAAINYTLGKRAYGYSGLGDVAVFIFFGVVAVGGTYLLQSKNLNWEIAMPAAAMGLLSVAVLNLNNLRDIENDEAHGKRTIPVKIGFENGKSYHGGLILIAWLLLTLWWMDNFKSNIELLFFLPAIIFVKHLKKALGTSDPADFDPELKKVALGTLLVALITFGLSLFPLGS